ncbi:hypothetical protein M6B38_345905 [Iris pallida]|uniref:Uncharacterized protein n=1 Tax=Iris pallida TaxID=29817 RepID=A0AAX6GTP3_IRIPA|nr:hypothetical protein M6B38_345905 [Iris pallida]
MAVVVAPPRHTTTIDELPLQRCSFLGQRRPRRGDTTPRRSNESLPIQESIHGEFILISQFPELSGFD